MPRLIFALFALIAIPSCECEPGPTGPAPYFAHLVTSPDAHAPNSIRLKKFQAEIRRKTLPELSALLEPLNRYQSINEIPTKAWEKPAHLVIDEIWSRNPNLRTFYQLLDGEGGHGLKNKIILARLGQTSPQEGWTVLQEYYRVAFNTHVADFTFSAATPFFKALQAHDPALGFSFIASVLSNPTYENSGLRFHGTAGLFCGMTKSDEVITFIERAREKNLENSPIGTAGPYFPNVDPNKFERSSLLINAVTFLSQISPPRARAWIAVNRNDLPKCWGYAYLHGCLQRPYPQYEAILIEVAKLSKRDDGILEYIFEEDYYRPDKELQKELLKIRSQNTP